MFLFQDASGQRVLIVRIDNGNGLLNDDRSMIEFFIYEVDGASGDLYPVGIGLFLRLQAGKGG